MAFVPVLNVAMLELRQTLDGEDIENTSYWLNDAGWDSGSLLELANFGADWWADNVMPLLSFNLSFREAFVTDLTTATSGVASYSTGLPVAGAVGQESEANNVAACISIRTAKRGRANRGRNYIAGIPSGKVQQNTIAADLLAALKSAYDVARTTGPTNGYSMVVVSRYSGYTIVDGKKKPTPRVTGLSEPVVSFSFTDDTVDSLRTRLPNH